MKRTNTRSPAARLCRWLSAAVLCAALTTSCAEGGPYDTGDAEEGVGSDEGEGAESASAALTSTEATAAAYTTKSKTVYSDSKGSKALAYYQKRGSKFYVIGIHVSDLKCDDMGAAGIAYKGGLGDKKTWHNDKGCKTDSYWGNLNVESTGICACDNDWWGCKHLNCVHLD